MKTLKKVLSVVLCIAVLAVGFVACSNDGESSDGKLKIGVIQFGSHPSLDNCYQGVVEGLETSKYKDKYLIDRQDGNFDSATCDTIAKNMVSKKYDLIVAIATPAAVSAYSAAANTDIPVIFCAVSDPVSANLVSSLTTPGGNCTGTSDILDFEGQVNMIKALQPDVKKIGVLYTTSEANSISQLKVLKEVAKKKGIEIVEQGIQASSDVPQAAASLASKVDCINNFTDNTVVNALPQLIEQANAANIPVYGSEVEQVKKGCIASVSIDYVKLGNITAQMIVKVLDGANPGDLAIETITDANPVMNSDVLKSFNITVPDQYKDVEMITSVAK